MHQDILIHPAEETGDLDMLLTLLAELIARVARSGQAPRNEPTADESALNEQPAAA